MLTIRTSHYICMAPSIHSYIIRDSYQDRTETLWLLVPVHTLIVHTSSCNPNFKLVLYTNTILSVPPTNPLRLLPTEGVSEITIHLEEGALFTHNNSPSCSTIKTPHCLAWLQDVCLIRPDLAIVGRRRL